jgi:hypothetical protein
MNEAELLIAFDREMALRSAPVEARKERTEKQMAKRSAPISGMGVTTIVHIDRLKEFERDGYATFTEHKPWIKASKRCSAGERIPVILSDAAYDVKRLRLWGWLVTAKIDDDKRTTIVQLRDIKRIRGRHYRTELRHYSDGKCFEDGFQWNYGLCQTPSFIAE